MSKLFTILALVLVMGTNTHRISSVETRGGWVYFYDETGHKYQTLSASGVGEVQGYSSTFMVSVNGSWVYLYDSEGNTLANFKTTMKDSGYPISISLSPNAELLCVSYLINLLYKNDIFTADEDVVAIGKGGYQSRINGWIVVHLKYNNHHLFNGNSSI